jgi:surfeit locus 1 family protein
VNAGGGKRGFLLILCLFGSLLFLGLGAWQVERRAWKLDMIERVDARVNAPPVAAPFRSIDPRADEYRRVRVTGMFLHGRETLVDALTEQGAGFWVMTPLQTSDGMILVNRGFVPPERKSLSKRLAGQRPGIVTVTGLLRLSEPGGRFLQPNRPTQGRFYSRDVAEIAKLRGLSPAVPYFIDADATPNPGGYPIGGLTVVTFRNMHLAYALTWFALAGLCLFGVALLLRPSERR